MATATTGAANTAFGVQEIIDKILTNLDFESLLRASQVSKHFRYSAFQLPDTESEQWTNHLPYQYSSTGSQTRFNMLLNRTQPRLSRKHLRQQRLPPRSPPAWQSSMLPERALVSHALPLMGKDLWFRLHSPPSYSLMRTPLGPSGQISLDLIMHPCSTPSSPTNSLNSTYLTARKVGGDWTIKIVDQKWYFAFSWASGRLTSRYSYQSCRGNGHKMIDDMTEDNPINWTVGELLVWLEQRMQLCKEDFRTKKRNKAVAAAEERHHIFLGQLFGICYVAVLAFAITKSVVGKFMGW